MQIRITRTRPGAIVPTFGTPRSAAFDFTAAETTVVPARKHAFVPTGLVFGLPDDHVLHIFARSSTFAKTGLLLANGVGVIDPDYSGPTDEISIIVYNPGDTDVTVTQGTRIAQGIIYPRPKVEFIEAEAAGPSRGGIGSTGGYVEAC